MKSKLSKKYIVATFLVITSLILSLIRENTFLILNGVITGKGSYKANTAPPEWLMDGFSKSQLLFFKWPLTLLFSLAFISITLIVIKVIFDNKSFRLVVGFYLIVILVGALTFLIGKLSGNATQTFKYVRYIVSIIQSPLILLISISVFSAQNRINNLE